MAADFVETRPVHKYPVKSGRDILEAQYKSGRGVLDRAEWAREAFEVLRRRCTHIPEEELVRLFHDRGQSQLELIYGDAIFREYNATHALGRRRTKAKVKPRAARVVSTPAVKPSKAAPAKAKAARGTTRPAKAPARKAAPKAKRRKR